MIRNSVSFALALVFILTIVPAAQTYAQQGSLVDGGYSGGFGGNPLGNVVLVPGSSTGASAGVYVTSVTHGDGSYTLHFIETDNAGIVISHTTETHSGENVTTGTELSNGETLGDIVGGMDGASTDTLGGGMVDPGNCLSFHCGPGSGAGDPFSTSLYSQHYNGG